MCHRVDTVGTNRTLVNERMAVESELKVRRKMKHKVVIHARIKTPMKCVCEAKLMTTIMCHLSAVAVPLDVATCE